MQQHDPNAIWTPSGYIPPDVRQAQLAVEAYSEDLELGRDERLGTWVALWKNGPDGKPYPAISITQRPDEPLPSYERIQQILYTGDVARRGRAVLDEVIKRQEERRKADDAKAHEIAGEVAEYLEHTFRRQGKTQYTKVYLPGKDF